MNKTTEALKLSEEALLGSGYYDTTQQRKALAAIREARAEQEKQEPVAIVDEIGLCLDGRPIFNAVGKVKVGQKLYAAPVHTKDLTDDEINALIDKSWIELMTIKEFARAVIAKFKEKNK